MKNVYESINVQADHGVEMKNKNEEGMVFYDIYYWGYTWYK